MTGENKQPCAASGAWEHSCCCQVSLLLAAVCEGGLVPLGSLAPRWCAVVLPRIQRLFSASLVPCRALQWQRVCICWALFLSSSPADAAAQLSEVAPLLQPCSVVEMAVVKAFSLSDSQSSSASSYSGELWRKPSLTFPSGPLYLCITNTLANWGLRSMTW